MQNLRPQLRNVACLPYDDVTQGDLLNHFEELQPEDNLRDHSDTGDDGVGEISDGATQISDIAEDHSSSSNSSAWPIDSTLSNLFSHVFQRPSDEIAFTYCE